MGKDNGADVNAETNQFRVSNHWGGEGIKAYYDINITGNYSGQKRRGPREQIGGRIRIKIMLN